MRKTIAILILGLFVIRVLAIPHVALVDRDIVQIDPGQLFTARSRFVTLDSTASGATASALGVTNRTYQAVKTLIAAAANNNDEISIFDIPRSWNGAIFNAIGVTENSTVAWDLHTGTLGEGNLDSASTSADCALAYLGRLTFTIGTQGSLVSTFEFADTVTATPSDKVSTWGSKSPGSNRKAEARIDLDSDDLLIAVPITATSDCKLLGKGY